MEVSISVLTWQHDQVYMMSSFPPVLGRCALIHAEAKLPQEDGEQTIPKSSVQCSLWFETPSPKIHFPSQQSSLISNRDANTDAQLYCLTFEVSNQNLSQSFIKQQQQQQKTGPPTFSFSFLVPH